MFDPKTKTITIDPKFSGAAEIYPFDVADLAPVAAQLRASGKATMKLRRPGPLAGNGLGLALHELAHLTGMNVRLVKNLPDRVEMTARPWKR